MSKQPKAQLRASQLRIILIISMALIILLAVGGFLFSRSRLTDYALDVSKKTVDANASNGNLRALEKIKQELAANQDAVRKADLLKSNNKFPEFQIVDDVTKYADNNGVKISSFEYVDSDGKSTKQDSSAPAPSTTTPPATPNAAAPTTATLNRVAIKVTVANPVNYKSLLQFIYDIEQNVPKMQVGGIKVSKTDSSNSVTADPLIIEMYTK